jgi:hypothetical protein
MGEFDLESIKPSLHFKSLESNVGFIVSTKSRDSTSHAYSGAGIDVKHRHRSKWPA